jgi:hypothetical protein
VEGVEVKALEPAERHGGLPDPHLAEPGPEDLGEVATVPDGVHVDADAVLLQVRWCWLPAHAESVTGALYDPAVSVLVEAISVVVRRDALERAYPGGVAAYERDCPNQTFCADEHLTRVGFMTPDDARNFVEQLEDRGLTFLDGERSMDIAVLFQGRGLMMPCDWIEHGRHPDGYEMCWLAGTEPGSLAAPEGWTPEQSRGIHHVSAEGETTHIRPGIEPGDQLYVGRVSEDPRAQGRSDQTNRPTLEDAIAFAVDVHRGQKDKAGEPYILHPLTIMLRVEGKEAKMAAALHDVVEDGGITVEELTARGYPEAVVRAVDLLTKRHDKGDAGAEEAYIEAIAADPVARTVKIADLEHNMEIRRLTDLTDEDATRMAKYLRQWRRLTSPDRPAGRGLIHLVRGESSWAHLPPGGYPNLATKQDLLDLERRIVGELKSFTLRTILTANIGMAAAFAAIAFTAAGIG